MDAFPYLKPNEINYDLGLLNVSQSNTFSGGPVVFRHSLALTNNKLVLTFLDLVEDDVDLIRQHFIDSAGEHLTFAVPSVTWGNSTNVVSSGSLYRYAARPNETHKGVYTDIQVKLIILTGIELTFNLYGGGAALPTESAFGSYAFNGTDPFILNLQGATNTSTTMLLKGGGSRL